MGGETLGRIVSTFVPSGLLLKSTLLGDWYDKNPYHKFNEGDILILKDRATVGYGIRPVAVVNGYDLRKEGFWMGGEYDITLHIDKVGDFLRWINENEFQEGVERGMGRNESHFKRSIENDFSRALVDSVEEALACYRSLGVDQKSE